MLLTLIKKTYSAISDYTACFKAVLAFKKLEATKMWATTFFESFYEGKIKRFCMFSSLISWQNQNLKLVMTFL